MKKTLSLILILLVLSALSPLVAQSQNATPDPIRIWISDGVPSDVRASVLPLFDMPGYVWTDDLQQADLAVDYERPGGELTSQWVYVPVVSFASLAEDIRWEDIQRYWAGDVNALSYLTANGIAPTFVGSRETIRAMVSLLGLPAENVPLHLLESTEEITPLLWQTRPYSWGVMGFSDLNPQLKALTLDGNSVFADAFDPNTYPLTAHLALKGESEALAQAITDLTPLGTWQATNRNPALLGRVVLTGVTALTRAMAFKMEELGLTFPANGIMPFLSDAHLLHTSNEVSFSENCGAPDPYGGVIFCSRREYVELLTHIGLDVVELTGNHINDYGPGAFRYTLDIYAELGIATFGGGYTPDDARDAYMTEVNGTSIAFIGCNVVGPFGAWASDVREGSAQCDDAYLDAEVARLAATVDVVIVTFQEWEYYRYTVGIEQLQRFERYAALGADVVIGSQAHQPQGFTFSNGAFLHHGLGNLFFDQMQNIGTRQMFADKLILYDGQLINVVLFTGLIEDFCCPRPMTTTERADFLNTIFQASGW